MRYEAPNSLDQAVALLAKETGDARVLAGGTDLLVQMRTDIIDPDLVVDIKGIAETARRSRRRPAAFASAPPSPGAELKEHAKLKSVWPGVVEAANLIGSTQVQGRATIGGNLCNGSPAADSVPALIAAGAKASIVGPKGRRDVPVEDVDAGPAQDVADQGRDHRLVPAAAPSRRARAMPICASFRAPRWTSPWSAAACASRSTPSGICTAARVSLGAVAPRPLLVAPRRPRR